MSVPHASHPAATSVVLRHPSISVGILALVAFLPSLVAGFIYDDVLLISENSYTHELGSLYSVLTSHFWESVEATSDRDFLHYYRPIPSASFILDWFVGGGRAWYFHATNVLLHSGCSLLVTRALTRWIKDPRLALVTGLVFALHPTRTESVIWISGRTDLFMVLFSFLTLELLHRANHSSSRLKYAASAAASGVLALLSKEPAVLLPLLIAVDYQLSSSRGRAFYKRALLASSVTAAGYLLARFALLPVQRNTEAVIHMQRGLLTIARYIERIALPWPQTFFYQPLEANSQGLIYPKALVLMGAAFALAYGAATVWLLRKDRPSVFLLLTGALLLAPLLNFVSTGLPFTTCDRFLYLPLGLMAAAAARQLTWPSRTWLVHLGVATFVIGSLFVSTVRSIDYRTGESHWLHERAVNPNNPEANVHLGLITAGRGQIAAAYRYTLQANEDVKKYPLFNSPPARFGRYVRLLAFRAALTPDGDFETLTAIDGSLHRLTQNQNPNEPTWVKRLGFHFAGDKEHLEKVLAMPPAAPLYAAAAFVSARLGNKERALANLSRIPDAQLSLLPDPLNLVLTHARVGDFTGARRRLASLALSESSAARDASQRVATAEQYLRQEPGPVGRAKALLHLGAYREALRTLKPLFERADCPVEVSQQYVQLLVASRLEEEAVSAVARHLPPEQAPQVVAQLRSQLPTRLQEMPPIPGPAQLSLP